MRDVRRITVRADFARQHEKPPTIKPLSVTLQADGGIPAFTFMSFALNTYTREFLCHYGSSEHPSFARFAAQ